MTYSDYVGTAQLDQKATGESALKLAGIDEEKWLVIGFDIGGGEHDHDVSVVAVDMESVPEGVGNVIDRLMQKHGHIPVKEIHLHDVDPYEFLKSITHMFELRMRVQHTAGKDIMVTSVGDIPEQS